MYNFIKSVDEKKFDNFILESSMTSIFSLSVRKDIKEADKRFVGYLVGMEDEKQKLVAVAMLLYKPTSRVRTMWITYGPVLDYKNENLFNKFISEIEKFCKSLKIDVILIEPPYITKKYDNKLNQIYESDINIKEYFKELNYEYLGDKDLEGGFQLRYTSIVDLDCDEKALLNKLSSSKKSYLNKNDKYYKIRLVEGNVEDLQYLMKYRNQLAEEKDFNVDPILYYENYYNLVNRDYKARIVKVVIDIDDAINNMVLELNSLIDKEQDAKEKEKNAIINQISSLKKRIAELEDYKAKNACNGDYVIGCALRLYIKDTMFNIFAHMDKTLTNIGATNVLVYEMMREAREMGYKYNDLYGIPNPFDKDGKDYNLATFKLEFGGELVECAGAFKKVLNRKRYILFNVFSKINRVVRRKKSCL